MRVRPAVEQTLDASVDLLTDGTLPISTTLKVKQICDRLEMSPSTFYLRFGDIEHFHLLAATWWAVDRTTDGPIDDPEFLELIEHLDPEKRVLAIVDGYCDQRSGCATPWPETSFVPWLPNTTVAAAYHRYLDTSIRHHAAILGDLAARIGATPGDSGRLQVSLLSHALGHALDRPRFFDDDPVYRRLNRAVFVASLDQVSDDTPVGDAPTEIADPVPTELHGYFERLAVGAELVEHPVDHVRIEGVAARLGAAPSTLRSQVGAVDVFRHEVMTHAFRTVPRMPGDDVAGAMHHVLLDTTPTDEALGRLLGARARELAAVGATFVTMDPAIDRGPFAPHWRALGRDLAESFLVPVWQVLAASGRDISHLREDDEILTMVEGLLLSSWFLTATTPPWLAPVAERCTHLLGRVLDDILR